MARRVDSTHPFVKRDFNAEGELTLAKKCRVHKSARQSDTNKRLKGISISRRVPDRLMLQQCNPPQT
jgi:hypothetical protein